MAMQKSSLKIVAIGDPKTGKTSLLSLFTGAPLPKEYQETVQTASADFVLQDYKLTKKSKKLQINFYDTSGQPNLVRMRTLSYPSTDVFLLVFDVNERVSFRNACKRWLEEAKAHQPGAKYVLIGMNWSGSGGGSAAALAARRTSTTPKRHPHTPGKKSVDFSGQGPVTFDEVDEILPKLGIDEYFEINPRTSRGVQEALEGIVQIATLASHGKKAHVTPGRARRAGTPSRGAGISRVDEDEEEEKQQIARVDVRKRDKKNVKIVVVGDTRIGKTTFLHAYTQQKYKGDEYEASVGGSEVFSPHIHKIHNIPYTLSLWDMSGNPDHRRLRFIGYPDTDVVLLCFDISDPRTLENCVKVWSEEIHNNVPTAPVLLVGLKSDLRQGNTAGSVSEEDVRAAQAHIPNCAGYLECSSKNIQRGQKEIIDGIIYEAIAACVKVPSKRRCVIL